MVNGSLDFRNRTAMFDALDGAVFDLVIVGGGITGAGVARDAAMRGLSVALFEARDFASGTSSRSSKMIHGGLRYMAQGDLALVHEAASERKAVEAIAPHLTRRTPFVIPSRTHGGVMKLRAGLWAFEKLGGVPAERRHEVWSQKDIAANEPSINADELAGAVVYPEYLTEDARLTLANVRTAAAHGASVLSYAPVLGFMTADGRVTGLTVGDHLAGDEVRAEVFGKVVVNAAGPWVDVVRALEDPDAGDRVQLTKGVHLVVARASLPVERTIIMPAADKRSVFAVPKGDFTYIGTTDTFHHVHGYWPEITSADVAYLLAAAARRFSTRPLTPADLVAAWAGVRPLVAQDGKSASEISRRDEIWTGPGGLLSIAGGKLTAYRRMAERIVDRVQERLGHKPTACATAVEPLVGGDLDPAAAIAALGGEPGEAARRVGLYGAEAAQVGAGPAAEARHSVLHEGALTLEDYWVRRSGRAWFDHGAGLDALAPAAAEMAGLLCWTAAEQNRQVDHCRRLHEDSLSGVAPVNP